MSIRRALPLALLVLGWNPASAAASAITFNINCYITSAGCTAGTSYGTLTLTDVIYLGDAAVQVDVDLTGDSVHKVQEILLNYDTAAAGTALPNLTLSDGTGLTYSSNSLSADGYQGDFDIQIPDTGNLGTEPFSAIIYGAAGADLFASYFNLTVPAAGDVTDRLYIAVHIGNTDCTNDTTGDCTPGTGGSGSLWMGNKGGGGTTRDVPPAPEPATLVLLGLGLYGVAARAHRRR